MWPCAVGKSGVRLDKTEGDGATPAGCWPIRRVLYRADRLALPETSFPCAALQPHDGWCDAPGDANYNRQVCLPYPGRYELLWREDEIYDVVVVLGYNDAPVRPGAGSAIFLHLARRDLAPTEGCVALRPEDLLTFLKLAAITSQVCVDLPGPGAGQSY